MIQLLRSKKKKADRKKERKPFVDTLELMGNTVAIATLAIYFTEKHMHLIQI